MPPAWREALNDPQQQGLFMRGMQLLPKQQDEQRPDVRGTGLWQTVDKLDGEDVVFATDGSGGPSPADQRFSAAGFAIAAFRLNDSVLECVATISGTFAGAQTAQRAEVFAWTTLLKRTSGNVDCAIDSQYVKKQWCKPHPSGAHVDL